MKLIDWNKKFEIGIEPVDFEHREMIETINTTLKKIYKSGDEVEISNLLAEIHTGISAHFALEEQIMKSTGYDQYREHKDDHERLLDEIREIMDDFEGKEGAAVETLLAGRLISWFTDHFRTFDARLHKAYRR